MLQTIEQTQAPVLSPVKNYAVLAASKKYNPAKKLTLDVKSILRPKELDVCPEREEDQIEEFRAKYAELDKCDVFWVESLGAYVCTDGWSRLDVANELLIVTEEFNNKGKGTLEDALKLRVKSNGSHGKRWKRPQWVKACWNMHEILVAKNKKQSLADTAKFLGINYSTFAAFFRFRDGFSHDPVDHPFVPLNVSSRKKKIHPADRLVTASCASMARAIVDLNSLFSRYRPSVLSQEQKDRVAKQLAKLKAHWEKL